MGPFKSFVMNNKAFRNLVCNPQKSFFHSSPTLIIEAVNHSLNSTIAFTKKKKKKIHVAVIFSSKCYCWVWRMVDSLYYSSWKIPERCENSFVDYRINYQKLCYLMRQMTKDLNSVSVYGYKNVPTRLRYLLGIPCENLFLMGFTGCTKQAILSICDYGDLGFVLTS